MYLHIHVTKHLEGEGDSVPLKRALSYMHIIYMCVVTTTYTLFICTFNMNFTKALNAYSVGLNLNEHKSKMQCIYTTISNNDCIIQDIKFTCTCLL